MFARNKCFSFGYIQNVLFLKTFCMPIKVPENFWS